MTGTWNLSLIDPGPNGSGIQVPVYGAPTTDPDTGLLVPTILGYEDGYHLNGATIVLDTCPAAAAYQVEPASPVTVWGSLPGAPPTPTIFFKFPDQATAIVSLAPFWDADALAPAA